MRIRRFLMVTLAGVAGVEAGFLAGPSHARAGADGAPRFADETPDAMLEDAVARVGAHGAGERDGVAAVAEILALSDRAEYGAAARALGALSQLEGLGPDLTKEAALAARRLSPDEGSAAGEEADRALGVLTQLSLLGPFRDTGGGLGAKDGPEAAVNAGAGVAGLKAFTDLHAHYAWGTVDVTFRAVPPAYAGAAGVPLDLFLHPRKESCSLLASVVNVDPAQPLLIRAAATGQVRLMFDGAELARSEEVHTSAIFDRVAGKVFAPAGKHLVWAKVCSGALDDEGRVRLRVTTPDGAAVAGLSPSADLTQLTRAASSGPAAGAKKAAPKPLKVEARTTPLARTLSFAGKNGEGALAAAIARTLGGADDARSPRAPGLLDSITRRTGGSADELAMAGWVAPSGANRSGWLNEALARATGENDPRTRAFVERRIVAEHLNARMSSWALAAARGAKLEEHDDPEAVQLVARAYEAIGTDALRSMARTRLAAAFAELGSRAPSGLVSTLATFTENSRPQDARAAEEELSRRGEGGPSFVTAEATLGARPASLAASSLFSRSLEDADDALAVASTVSRTGAHEAARRLYEQLVAWAPNRPEAWAGLASEISAGSEPDREAAIRAALVRARELAPGEARYRAQLALREASTRHSSPSTPDAAPREDLAGDRQDERYLVAPAVFLARRKGVPESGAPDVADRELHWLRAVVMHPDLRVSTLIHYAREIVIAPRTQEELYEELPAEGDLTEILRARVHRKSGGIAFPTEEHNEGTRPRIRWPDLLPGDTVEVALREWTSTAVGGRADAPFYFMDYAGAVTTHPLLYNEVVVEAPPEHPLYLDVLHGEGTFTRTEHDENGRHVTRLVWAHPNQVADEPLSPAQSELVPMVVGSTFHDWLAFRAWYTEAVRGFTEPDDEVRRLAAELTRGKTTRDQKLQALFNFVSDDIRYVNYTSGEWWLPNRPQQLLARREGDCDDKAILLITLLRAVGIEAREVMVQTRLTGQPSIVLAKNAAVPLFDHGIAFLPGPNGGTYLDATSPESRLGPLPSMDARAVALKIDTGEIVQLPASTPEDHGGNVDWTLKLHPDGKADLTGEEKHTGDGAFWLRTNLTEEGARRNYVESSLVGPWFSTMEVDEGIDFQGDLAQGRAWVKYKAHGGPVARKEQGELFLPFSASQSLASQLAPLLTRTLPLSLPPQLAPSHETRTLKILAPAGFRWAALPPGGDADGGEFGRAHLEVSRDPGDPNAVRVTRTLQLNADRIPVEKYAAFRAWLQRVDALMHRGVRMLPSAPGADK